MHPAGSHLLLSPRRGEGHRSTAHLQLLRSGPASGINFSPPGLPLGKVIVHIIVKKKKPPFFFLTNNFQTFCEHAKGFLM